MKTKIVFRQEYNFWVSFLIDTNNKKVDKHKFKYLILTEHFEKYVFVYQNKEVLDK